MMPLQLTDPFIPTLNPINPIKSSFMLVHSKKKKAINLEVLAIKKKHSKALKFFAVSTGF